MAAAGEPQSVRRTMHAFYLILTIQLLGVAQQADPPIRGMVRSDTGPLMTTSHVEPSGLCCATVEPDGSYVVLDPRPDGIVRFSASGYVPVTRSVVILRTNADLALEVAAPDEVWTPPICGKDTDSLTIETFRMCFTLSETSNSSSGQPHIYGHEVSEGEVEAVLGRPMEERPGEGGARIAFGQTVDGRYLRVVFVPDAVPNSVFVIAAYELGPKAKRALRRGRKKAK